MKKAKIFLPKGAIIEATAYFVSMIEEALAEEYEIESSESNFVASDIDLVVTIIPKHLLKLKYERRQQKPIYLSWYQGIGPEEVRLNGAKYIWFWNLYYTFAEKYSLKKSQIHLFTSLRMKAHFEKKYGLNFNQSAVVIPCFNKELDLTSFDLEGKYKRPSFVYAGGLHEWQCIEETLQVFKIVQEYYPEATLTLLTGDHGRASELIEKYKLVNVSVDYVKLEELQDELKKYKYGFVLRRDHIVNNVATPTKMNSYLAAGIIPIYTNVIDSFEKNLVDFKDKISVNLEKQTISEIAQKVIDHHRSQNIEVDHIRGEFMTIFNTYYNRDMYIDNLRLEIKKLAKKNI